MSFTESLTPFVRAASKRVLFPRPDNFTPPKRTPWGGHEIAKHFKAHLGIQCQSIIGESWELSSHPDFPSLFDLGLEHPLPLTVLQQGTLTYLVKVLNSGSWHQERQQIHSLLPETISSFLTTLNHGSYHLALSALAKDYPKVAPLHHKMLGRMLSLQLHPNLSCPSNLSPKHEAWVILQAEPGAGIYLGLKTGVSKEDLLACLHSGDDPAPLLHFIPVAPGDVYNIPPGTLHAIGAGILLLEPQGCTQITWRAYDWGYQRELHLDKIAEHTCWDQPQGDELAHLLCTHRGPLPSGSCRQVKTLVDTPFFSCSHILLPKQGDLWITPTPTKRPATYFIHQGTVEMIENHRERHTLKHGRSFFIPVGTPHCHLFAKKENTSLFCIF